MFIPFFEEPIATVIAAVLVFLADYIVVPLFKWVAGWSIFKCFRRLGLGRERRRQSGRLLAKGLELLRSGSTREADVRFGAALKLDPQLVWTLSKKQRQLLTDELERHGGDANAARLWLDLRSCPIDSSPRGDG